MTPTPFNFAKPRLPAERHRVLRVWFQTGLGLVRTQWTRDLPNPVEPAFQEIETGAAKDTVSFLESNAVAFRVHAGNTVSLLVFSRPFLLGWINAALGDSIAQLPADRDLTAVERSLAEYLLTKTWLPNFRESAPFPDPGVWKLGEREDNPRCSRLFPPNDLLVAAYWKIKGEFGEQQAAWLWSKKEIDAALGSSTATTAPSPAAEQKIVREVADSFPLPVSIVLGTAECTLEEIASMSPGDVFLLNQRVDEPIKILVSGKPKLQGWLGRTGSWKIVQVLTPKED